MKLKLFSILTALLISSVSANLIGGNLCTYSPNCSDMNYVKKCSMEEYCNLKTAPCTVCEEVTQTIASNLDSEAIRDYVDEQFDGMCDDFKAEKTCEYVVNTTVDYLTKILSQELSDNTTCTDLGFC